MESEVLIMRLCGKKQSVKVVKPLTVQMKIPCVTCGKVNKSSDIFCSKCGTAVNLI